MKIILSCLKSGRRIVKGWLARDGCLCFKSMGQRYLVILYLAYPNYGRQRFRVYICVLFLLVVGALGAGVGGRKLGEKGAGLLTSSCLIISLSWSVLIFYEIILSYSTTHIKL